MKTSLLKNILPASLSNRLSILIFHRVLSAKDPMMPSEPSVEEFDWMMKLLRRRFNPMPLHEGLDRLNAGSLPPLSVAVTFDDGYRDNLTNALPVMERYGVPSTVFVSSGSLDGGRMWNDTVTESVRSWSAPEVDLAHCGLGTYALNSVADRRIAAESINRKLKYFDAEAKAAVVAFLEKQNHELPRDLMLTTEDVIQLRRRGVEIGAHTVSHPILAELTSEDALNEITHSKSRLESIITEPVRLFAYPNGKANVDYNTTNVTQCRTAGFDYAVSTNWGVATSASQPFEIPRFTPWDRTPARFGLRLLQNLTRTQSDFATP